VQKDFWAEVISLLQKTLQPFLDDGTVHNLQFDVYRREIERYGLETMELSEKLFCHHSVAVMEFISLLEGDEGEQLRWQVGLKAIDLLLDDFEYTTDQKLNLVKALNKTFSEEFRIGHAERKKISAQFNDHKLWINELMSNEWKENENLAQAIPVFTIQTDKYRRTVEGIIKAPSVRSNKLQLDYLMQSYLHMFINRLFVSNQRKVELVLYEYLLKYYESKMAREKMAIRLACQSSEASRQVQGSTDIPIATGTPLPSR
jgi:thiopeptide-type bacteriocin biosynthesis protein